MTLIIGIAGSIIAAVIIALALWIYRRWFGQQIKITQPADNETLTDPRPLGSAHSFIVRGTLKHRPEGHRVWLLVKRELTGKYWPQSFFMAEQRDDDTWTGRVSAVGQGRITIVAVLAPPTSQDLF